MPPLIPAWKVLRPTCASTHGRHSVTQHDNDRVWHARSLDRATTAVTFGGVVAPVGSWTLNSITVTVPSGAATGNVVVNVGGLNSNSLPFTITP